jgi:hypothetical protein
MQRYFLFKPDVQNKMLAVAISENEDDDYEEEEDLQIYRDLIKQIYAGSKEYKRKSKKCRNLSIQAPNVKKSK